MLLLLCDLLFRFVPACVPARVACVCARARIIYTRVRVCACPGQEALRSILRYGFVLNRVLIHVAAQVRLRIDDISSHDYLRCWCLRADAANCLFASVHAPISTASWPLRLVRACVLRCCAPLLFVTSDCC